VQCETPHSARRNIRPTSRLPRPPDSVDANWHASSGERHVTATDNAAAQAQATSFQGLRGSAVRRRRTRLANFNPAQAPRSATARPRLLLHRQRGQPGDRLARGTAKSTWAVTGCPTRDYTSDRCRQPSPRPRLRLSAFSGKSVQVTAPCTDSARAVSVTTRSPYCATSLNIARYRAAGDVNAPARRRSHNCRLHISKAGAPCRSSSASTQPRGLAISPLATPLSAGSRHRDLHRQHVTPSAGQAA